MSKKLIPITEISNEFNDKLLYNNNYNESFLLNNGYNILYKISNTLQGTVYYATKINNKSIELIVKCANIDLVAKKLGKYKNIVVPVDENIFNETLIMMYLTTKYPVPGFVRPVDFIKDTNNYYLIMDYGGESLIEYIKEIYKLLHDNIITINEWNNNCKILFKQMIILLQWIHNNNVCHMDISLENMVINQYQIINGKFINNGIISFIDYGLAIKFKNNNHNFKSKKFVGKKQYQSPEIRFRKIYDARMADIWALGTCMYMIKTGDLTLNNFNINIKNKNNDSFIDLISKIFTLENKRININDILSHKYFVN